MVQKSSRYNHLNNRSGFTLIELMVVISIIGILALIALPSYKRYVYEAKAAEIFHRIHTISSAYSYVSAINPEVLNNHVELSSSDFGLAPSYLSGLANQFTQLHNIEFSAQLVNHSGYFQFTGGHEFPVLFLKATDQNGIEVLNAVDHVAKFKHAFVTPDIMMIALVSPYELQHNVNQPPNSATGQTSSQTAAQVTDQTAGQATDQPTGQATDQPTGQATDQPTGQPTDQPTGQPTAQPTGQPTDQPNGQPTTQQQGSTAGNQLNWPPGWVKHPEKHQNQQHGHQ